jgi:hypothetical protein
MYAYDTVFGVFMSPAQVDVATSSCPVTSNFYSTKEGKSVMNSHVPFEIQFSR